MPNAQTLSVAALLLIPALAAAQQDPLTGVFAGSGLRMVVLTDADGSYAGRFELGTDVIPFTARPVGEGGLRGNYFQGDGVIPFEGLLQGDRLVVGDGSRTYVLRRVAATVPEDVAAAVLANADQAGTAGSGAAIELPRLGVRFEPPPGWAVTEQEGGYLLKSSTTPGEILLFAHTFGSLDELRSAVAAGYTEADVRLRPNGELEAFGERGLTGSFTGSAGGTPVRARAITLLSGRGDGGATMLAVAPEPEFGDRQESALETLAESFEFFEPREPDAVTLWKEKLTDARLTYMYGYYSNSPDGAYVGASEETIIDLCRAGFFNYGSSSSLAADGGFGGEYNVSGLDSSRKRGSGAWELLRRGPDVVLHLDFHDGSTREYTLGTDEEGKTLLDGRKYYRTFASSPLAEARPDCP